MSLLDRALDSFGFGAELRPLRPPLRPLRSIHTFKTCATFLKIKGATRHQAAREIARLC
jgi:hypothetical protein